MGLNQLDEIGFSENDDGVGDKQESYKGKRGETHRISMALWHGHDDKDFGEKIYREHHPHHGVILLRLEDERAATKIQTLGRLLQSYADRLPEKFVAVTETKVRFARQ